jgi:hypothetical protein
MIKAPTCAKALTITQSGAVFNGGREELQQLKDLFQQQNYIRLPSLVSPEILELLMNEIENTNWTKNTHEGIGTEICANDPGIVAVMDFLFNDEKLFQILEHISACGSIGIFSGRIYRMVPEAGHYDSWHTDAGQHRLLALSLNLSKEPYDGGVLQIREQNSTQRPVDIPNRGLGDAILFRLGPHLSHRVKPMVGSRPKTAYAGWFRSEPNYWDSLMQKLQQNEG